MMRRTIVMVGILALAGVAAWAGAQAPTPPGDEQGLRQAAKSYAEALDRGDLEAIVAMWTGDADYVDENGTNYKGRDAIRKLFSSALPTLKTNKTSYKITSVRFVKADVAITDGDADIAGPDGTSDHGRFTAVWTKVGNQWQIASARDLPVADDAQIGDRQLKDLEWLVGDWTATDRGMTVKLAARWALDRKFLKLEFTVTSAEGPPMLIVSYVGWDPTEGQLHGWTFDSRGGFGDTAWSRDGGIWMVDSSAVLPNGQTGTTTYLIKSMGVDSFSWRATEREIEGQPLPDSELKYSKVAK